MQGTKWNIEFPASEEKIWLECGGVRWVLTDSNTERQQPYRQAHIQNWLRGRLLHKLHFHSLSVCSRITPSVFISPGLHLDNSISDEAGKSVDLAPIETAWYAGVKSVTP